MYSVFSYQSSTFAGSFYSINEALAFVAGLPGWELWFVGKGPRYFCWRLARRLMNGKIGN